jgi:hypothetical protein
MTSAIQIGLGASWRKVSDVYIGVGGAWRTVQTGYIGVDGQWRQFFTNTPPLVVTPVDGNWVAEETVDGANGIPTVTGYDGSCSVEVSGGVAPYHFSWDADPTNTSFGFSMHFGPDDLPGTVVLNCTVTDSNSPPSSVTAACTIS